ncbi:hypothetical protein [Geobacillus subterraneus]|uniref:hypothetical protein n=1 Tax=Geobacillus subterraneus TaxID=129338 RepID=UPI001442C951|nr:hypothetical protein [Geobacillus subterraneus]QIZ66603.1 hypothetical protein HF500_04460 [Geobacillus subterraneus]WPZ18817.1 hypothetical protein UM396_02390 [Geobacillus subterraneus]
MDDGAIRGIDLALGDAIPEADNPTSDLTTRDGGHFYFIFQMNNDLVKLTVIFLMIVSFFINVINFP